MPATDKVKRATDCHKELVKKKTPWFPHWQLLSEYIHSRKQDFTSSVNPGDFLNTDLFDNTASKDNATMASALLGLMWPNGAKSFRFEPPRGVKQTKNIKEYYEKISHVQADAMDDPAAGLATTLDEDMRDQGAFGTAGVEVCADDKVLPVYYRAWSVKELFISEGKNGRIDRVHLELEWKVSRLVATYGIDKVSEKTRENYENGKYDVTVKLLIAISERENSYGEGAKEGALAMEYESLHIELGADVLLKESGFEEIPILVARFYKLINEEYGRSPGMAALPDVLEINAMWEAVTIAVEKSLDPPLAILDDGRLGGGTIDTSAGAVNVFNITGRAGERQPIFPLFTVGEFQHVEKLIERLENSIADAFFIDRLLDLNNEKEMTAYETAVRNKLRGSTLNTLIARQAQERFNPMIQRTFNILFKKGLLGVVAGSVEEKMLKLDGATDSEIIYIPDEIAQLMAAGRDVYKIKYISPAARIMDAEVAQGIIETWTLGQQMAQTNPEALDILDADVDLREYRRITGAGPEGLRAQDDIDKIRAERAAANQAAMQLQTVGAGAKAVKDLGQSGIIDMVGAKKKK